MAKPCEWCNLKPKRRKPDGQVLDNYCSAKCKKAARWEWIKDTSATRVCDPDTGWF